MTYFNQLNPWCIIRSLPNMQSQIIGRFRRRVDAEGHLRILKQMIPNVRFEIMFDIAPQPTDSLDLTPPTPLPYQGMGSRTPFSCKERGRGRGQPRSKAIMTSLFRRLQPAKKFRITLTGIAQLLKIPKHLVVRVECWAYVVFVHRTDRGGQFISYRQLQKWTHAVACQIQHCSTWQQLRSLWLAIEEDYKMHKPQYDEQHHQFLYKIWTKYWNALWNEQELAW